MLVLPRPVGQVRLDSVSPLGSMGPTLCANGLTKNQMVKFVCEGHRVMVFTGLEGIYNKFHQNIHFTSSPVCNHVCIITGISRAVSLKNLCSKDSD